MQVHVGEQRLNLPRIDLDPRVEAILRDPMFFDASVRLSRAKLPVEWVTNAFAAAGASNGGWQASVADNLPAGWRTVAPALAERPAADVLVLGGGGGRSIPLYAVDAAVALGAKSVTYVERS